MTSKRQDGLAAGIAAYAMWGFLPLLFHALRDVPPFELVAWRVVFTLPVCLALVAGRRGWDDLVATIAQPRLFARLALSACLIGLNWTIYVTAVVHGHVVATSLGYYINPLVNVLLGTALLGERLGRQQWLAVAVAGAGIALLVGGATEMLGIALALAVSFALYGLARKLTPVSAITGLTIETIMLYPLALVWALGCLAAPGGSSLGHGGMTAALLVGSGLATAIPLVLFAVAARNLPLSTLGFLQFIAPTLVFAIGIVVVGERLDHTKLACFVLIWIAVALFAHASWSRSKLA